MAKSTQWRPLCRITALYSVLEFLFDPIALEIRIQNYPAIDNNPTHTVTCSFEAVLTAAVQGGSLWATVALRDYVMSVQEDEQTQPTSNLDQLLDHMEEDLPKQVRVGYVFRYDHVWVTTSRSSNRGLVYEDGFTIFE